MDNRQDATQIFTWTNIYYAYVFKELLLQYILLSLPVPKIKTFKEILREFFP